MQFSFVNQLGLGDPRLHGHRTNATKSARAKETKFLAVFFSLEPREACYLRGSKTPFRRNYVTHVSFDFYSRLTIAV